MRSIWVARTNLCEGEESYLNMDAMPRAEARFAVSGSRGEERRPDNNEDGCDGNAMAQKLPCKKQKKKPREGDRDRLLEQSKKRRRSMSSAEERMQIHQWR